LDGIGLGSIEGGENGDGVLPSVVTNLKRRKTAAPAPARSAKGRSILGSWVARGPWWRRAGSLWILDALAVLCEREGVSVWVDGRRISG
jgi:hypothetical protein